MPENISITKLSLRPEIPSAVLTENMSSEERFQNQTLRPIIKMQHSLFIQVFNRAIKAKKYAFFDLPQENRKDYISQVLFMDVKFRTELQGMIVGQFTVEEYWAYSSMASALNKRMMNILRERMVDRMEEFEIIE